MIIRTATSKDFEGFYEINCQADHYHQVAVPSKFKAPNENYPSFMHKKFTNLIQSEDCIFLVATKEEQILGYLIALKKQVPEYPILIPRQYILIDNMGVHEQARQQGIGSLLLQQIEVEALKAGYSEIELNVYCFNKAAEKMYTKNDFKPMIQRMRKELKK